MKVLIVDDNYNIAETIADYLGLAGITVDFAYNGKALLSYLDGRICERMQWLTMMAYFG
ncbi:hypothetical protein [Moritella marina]|uniref:hypothetical protein n=1 Tax=Moritella marina TaxID=90736 RepID=UPI003703D2D4